MTRRLLQALTLAALGAAASVYAQAVGKAAPAFVLQDIAGGEHSLAAAKSKFVVLEWTNYDCPFVRKHYETGTMPMLQKTYIEKGVVWLTVCSSAAGKQGHYTVEQWSERIKKYGAVPTAVLLDADGRVGKSYGAKTTPHMFVISPEGVVLYNGAIDNQPGVDREIMKDAVSYVKQALDAALAGKPVAVTTTTPYGCSVKY